MTMVVKARASSTSAVSGNILLLLIAMLLAPVCAHLLRPTKSLATLQGTVRLEDLIPDHFASWHPGEAVIPLEVSPELLEKLKTIYDQTLSRSYVDESGNTIMLSIAYGTNQSRSLQLHRPEVCYSAQGFAISKKGLAQIDAGRFHIPVVRLMAVNGERNEPITYFMRVGDKIVRTGREQAWARYSYGFQGIVADGLLFRVSSLGEDENQAFDLQARFVGDLLNAMPDHDRRLLLGDRVGP